MLQSLSDSNTYDEDRIENFLDLDGFLLTAPALSERLTVQLERTSHFGFIVELIVETVGLQTALDNLNYLRVRVDEPQPVGVPADEGTVVLRLYLHVDSLMLQLPTVNCQAAQSPASPASTASGRR